MHINHNGGLACRVADAVNAVVRCNRATIVHSPGRIDHGYCTRGRIHRGHCRDGLA